MQIKPMNDYVLVDRYVQPSVTDTGLIIPENAKKLLTRGKVIAVGPGKVKNRSRRPIEGIKPGDEIIWVQQGVEKWFDKDNKPHILVEENYILAVVG